MTYVVSGLAGIFGAALGGVLFAVFGIVVAGWLGVSDREGGRGMFAVWGVAPFGVVGGLLLGVFLALRYHGGHTDFGAIAWRGGVVVLGIAALIGAGIAVRYQTLTNFTGNRGHPYLVFEIGLPPADVPARVGALKIELHTDHGHHDALVTSDAARDEDGLKIVAGTIELFHRTRQRLLVVKLSGRDVIFALDLARTPQGSPDYGPWRRARHVFETGAAGARAVRDDEPYRVRVRARWPGDD